MSSGRNIRYATDLITFYNASGWGHADPDVDLATIFSWGTVTSKYF